MLRIAVALCEGADSWAGDRPTTTKLTSWLATRIARIAARCFSRSHAASRIFHLIYRAGSGVVVRTMVAAEWHDRENRICFQSQIISYN